MRPARAAGLPQRHDHQVEFPAQGDDDMTVPFAGTQIHAEHWAPSCLSSKAGARPGGEFTTHSTPSIRHSSFGIMTGPSAPRGAVIGVCTVREAMASDSRADCLSCRSMRQWCHLARLDLSGPCAPSPLAISALKAARLVTDPAIRRTYGNAGRPEYPPDAIQFVLCIYCRTDKFVYWPSACRLPSADCPGCQRRTAKAAAGR